MLSRIFRPAERRTPARKYQVVALPPTQECSTCCRGAMDIDDPPQFPPSPLESSFTHPSPSPVPVIVENRAAARWLQLNPAIPATRLCADPPIYAVENFLTPEECQLLISAGAPGLSRSIVVDAKDGKSPAPSRTSESCYLLKSSTEWLHARVAALTGMPSVTHEPPQIARYTPNQFYLAHWDAFDITSSSGVECVATGGQRICTVLIYLNDVASGGGTFFPKIPLRMHPVRGSALIFFPCSLDAELDPQALHAAEPAIDEKWVCQLWIRQREFVN